MQKFFAQIVLEQKRKKSHLCVGLDPLPGKMPVNTHGQTEEPLLFLKKIVDATHDLACCFKPQFAHFAAQGLETELKTLIQYIKQAYPEIPVILDSKRGDIGSTAKMYALEAFSRYGADAVTVNPYMGGDTIEPFSNYQDKGVFILCRTSNPGAAEFQNLKPSGSQHKLYFHVAMQAMGEWSTYDNIGLVVGATALDELKELRSYFPEAWFLIPGVGAQGGDLAEVLQWGCQSQGSGGGIVNSSRAILYASSGGDYADAAREVALEMQKEMALLFNSY